MEDLDDIWTGFRSQTGAIRQEISALRAEMGGPLVVEADRAGRAIERALVRAIAQGKLSFEDLKRVALGVMAEIARSAIQAGIGAILGGGKASGGDALMNLAQTVAMSFAGSPGRATGGPVSGGRAYMVGERGPEYFVPTSSGRIEPIAGGGARPVSITINMHGAGGQDPQRMMQSGRQIARAVRRAMTQGED
jgi:hypothetical protein